MKKQRLINLLKALKQEVDDCYDASETKMGRLHYGAKSVGINEAIKIIKKGRRKNDR